jgi:hypothetical protein
VKNATSINAPSNNETTNATGSGSGSGSRSGSASAQAKNATSHSTKGTANATVPSFSSNKTSNTSTPDAPLASANNSSATIALSSKTNATHGENHNFTLALKTNASQPCAAKKARNESELAFENKRLPHELVGMDDKLKVAFNEGYDAGRIGAGKKPIMVQNLKEAKNISQPSVELSEAFLAGYNAGLASTEQPCSGSSSLLQKATGSLLSASTKVGRLVEPRKVKEGPVTMSPQSQSRSVERAVEPDQNSLDNAGRPALNTSSWVPANNVTINVGSNTSGHPLNESEEGAFTTVCEGVTGESGESTNVTCSHPGQICTATIPLYVCQAGSNGTTWQVYKADSTRLMNQSAPAPLAPKNNTNSSANRTQVVSESEAAVNWHPTYRPVSTSPCGPDEEHTTVALRGSEPCKQRITEEKEKAEWKPPVIVKNVTDGVHGKKLPCTDCESQRERKIRIMGMPKLADVDFSANVDGKKDLIKCAGVGNICEFEGQLCTPRAEHVDETPKQQRCRNGTWALDAVIEEPTLCDEIGGCNKTTPIVEPHTVELQTQH